MQKIQPMGLAFINENCVMELHGIYSSRKALTRNVSKLIKVGKINNTSPFKPEKMSVEELNKYIPNGLIFSMPYNKEIDDDFKLVLQWEIQ